MKVRGQVQLAKENHARSALTQNNTPINPKFLHGNSNFEHKSKLLNISTSSQHNYPGVGSARVPKETLPSFEKPKFVSNAARNLASNSKRNSRNSSIDHGRKPSPAPKKNEDKSFLIKYPITNPKNTNTAIERLSLGKYHSRESSVSMKDSQAHSGEKYPKQADSWPNLISEDYKPDSPKKPFIVNSQKNSATNARTQKDPDLVIGKDDSTIKVKFSASLDHVILAGYKYLFFCL